MNISLLLQPYLFLSLSLSLGSLATRQRSTSREGNLHKMDIVWIIFHQPSDESISNEFRLLSQILDFALICDITFPIKLCPKSLKELAMAEILCLIFALGGAHDSWVSGNYRDNWYASRHFLSQSFVCFFNSMLHTACLQESAKTHNDGMNIEAL